MKKFQLISLFLISCVTSIYSQDCKPTIVSEDGKFEYFGGKIRDTFSGLFSDDKSTYSFYIIQIDKGKNGNAAFVYFYESVKNRDVYNKAITDYLTTEKLRTSYLEIEVDNMMIKVPSISCTLEPKTTLGEIYGYTVNFEGQIMKNQVILLQKNNIKKFKIVLGGKPYERTFEKPNNLTQIMLKAMNCVNVDNMFDIQKKKPEEMDLNEVVQEDYSTSIIGKWLSQTANGVVIEYTGDKFIVTAMGKVVSTGNYKIIGTRLVFTGTTTNGASNNGISEFKMFLKDMIVFKNDAKENTYERIK